MLSLESADPKMLCLILQHFPSFAGRCKSHFQRDSNLPASGMLEVFQFLVIHLIAVTQTLQHMTHLNNAPSSIRFYIIY